MRGNSLENPNRATRSERVRLYWWRSRNSSRVNIHWQAQPFVLEQVELVCLGVINKRGGYFDIHGVFPTTPLPGMNPQEKTQMVRALRLAIEEQTGFATRTVTTSVVDWDTTWEDDL